MKSYGEKRRIRYELVCLGVKLETTNKVYYNLTFSPTITKLSTFYYYKIVLEYHHFQVISFQPANPAVGRVSLAEKQRHVEPQWQHNAGHRHNEITFLFKYNKDVTIKIP